MSFGANLENLRRKTGMQINTLEQYSGIPRQRLSEFEADKTGPTLTEVLALSYLFSTTPQELLDIPTDKNTKKTSNVQQQPVQQAQQTQVKQQTTNTNPNQAAQTANSKNNSNKKQEEPKAIQTDSKGKKAKGKGAKASEEWTTDDISAAFQQLQSGTQVVKNQNNGQTPQCLNPTQIQQQAISHAASSVEQEKPKKQEVSKKQKPTAENKANNQQQTANTKKQANNSKQQVASQSAEGETFGKKIKDAKQKNNLSYSYITKKLGITLSTYIQFELDHAMPNPELKSKICQLLKIEQ